MPTNAQVDDLTKRLDIALRAAQQGDLTALNQLRAETYRNNRVSRTAERTSYNLAVYPLPPRPAGMRKNEP